MLKLSSKNNSFYFQFREPKHPELETTLYNWIVEQRKSGVCVSGLTITMQALKLVKEMGIEDFHASLGWRERFLQRNSLVLRLIIKLIGYIYKMKRSYI